MIPFMDLKLQYESIKNEIDTAISDVIQSHKYINGPEVATFEMTFAAMHNMRFGVGCSSGTTALHLAFELLGLTRGDEVLVPTMTFIATTEPLRQVGAIPVFVDSDPLSYNISMDDLEKRITPKTKAIIAVHLHGNPCEMDKINAIAKTNNLKIIEDCSQAHLAEFQGKKVGGFADLTVFSFYPGKNLGAYGDAGVLLTNDKKSYEKAKMLINHGRIEKYLHESEGYNYRLDTLQAAILLVKLKHLEHWTTGRINNAKLYKEFFQDLDLGLPEMSPEKKHVYHIYAIHSTQREKIIGMLKEKQIHYGIHYPVPLHLQPAYKHLGYKTGDLPVAERLANTFISLPMYPELNKSQIEFICSTIKECL